MVLSGVALPCFAVPEAVSDLAAMPGSLNGSAVLSWSYPGPFVLPAGSFCEIEASTDSAIFFTTGTIGNLSFSTAVANTGERQSKIFTGLTAGATCYFAVWVTSVTETGVWTGLSNIATTYAKINHAPGAFDVLTPTGNVIIALQQPTFYWSQSIDTDAVFGDTVTYRIDYSSTAFLTYTSSSGFVSSYFNTGTDLVENAAYSWRIIAKDSDTYQAQGSSTGTFRINVLQEAPDTFNLSFPADNQLLLLSATDFAWQNSIDPDPGDSIVQYDIYWSKYPLFTPTHTSGVSSVNSYSVTDLADNTTYYWKVYARDTTGRLTLCLSTFTVRVDHTNSLPSAFNLLYSSGIVSQTSPEFGWSVSTDADPWDTVTYEVNYSSDNFITAISSAGLTTTVFTPTVSLIENATYQWSVHAVDNKGAVTCSSTWTVKINAGNEYPYAFSLSTPANNSIVFTNRPGFDWADSNDSDPGDYIRYTIWISTSMDFSTKVSSAGLVLSSFTPVANLTENATYYWSVRAIDSLGYETVSSTWAIRVNGANMPPSGISLSVSSGLVTINNPVFAWTASIDADPGDSVFYSVWLSSYSDFSVYTTSSGLRNPAYTPSQGLQENTTFYWSARAYDNSPFGSLQAVSSTWTICINAVSQQPGAFSLTSPVNYQMLTTAATTFVWGVTEDPDPFDRVSFYRIWWQTNPAFSPVQYQDTDVASVTVTGLVDNNTYYWKVEAHDTNGVFVAIGTWSVRVDITNSGPNTFSLISSSGVISTRRPVFRWAPATDTDPWDTITYRVEYATSTDFTTPVYSSGIAATSYTFADDLNENTLYYWRVYAVDNKAGETSSAVWNMTINSANEFPSNFVLSSPDNNQKVNTPRPSLDWSDATDNDAGDYVRYTVYYSSYNIYTSSGGLVLSSYTFTTNLVENATYYWFVAAKDTQNYRTFSSTYCFKVNAVEQYPSTFTLLLPANGATVNTRKPFFDWTNSFDRDPDDYITYTILLSLDDTFTEYIPYSGIVNSSFTPTAGLNENATYYWAVRAVDVTGLTIGSSTRTIVINESDDLPASFDLIYPANNDVVPSLKPNFQWIASYDNDANSIVTYTVQYSTSSNFVTYLSSTGIAANAFKPDTNLQDDVIYYWKVRAIDSTMNMVWSNQTTWMFSTNLNNSAPGAFDLVSPFDFTTQKTARPVLSWGIPTDSDPLDSVSYKLEYSKDSIFSAGNTYAVTVNTNTFVPLVDLADDTTYFWRVTAIDSFSAETLSTHTYIFFVNLQNTAPPAFNLQSPANAAMIVTALPVLDWQDSIDPDPLDYASYTLMLSTDTEFSTVTSYSGLSESNYALAGTGRLSENKKYYWKVLAADTTGAVTASAVWEFTVPVLSTPKEPLGIKSNISGTFVILRWEPVTLNEDGSVLDDLLGYNLYRADSLTGVISAGVYVALSSNTFLFQELITENKTFYYILKAVDTSGILSKSSIIINSAVNGNSTVVSEDNSFIIGLPYAENNKLTVGNNAYNDNLQVAVSLSSVSVLSNVISEYEVKVKKASDGSTVTGYQFGEAVEITFPLTGLVSAGVLSTQNLTSNELAIYWFNGVEYIKTGSSIAGFTIQIRTKNTGRYQLRRAGNAGTFMVNSVWPSKIFTPNGDGINDTVNISYENPIGIRVTGKIFDLNGRFTANMAEGSMENTLKWDGKDSDGSHAPKGIYIYQLDVEGKVVNGTVVVAR